MEDLERGERRSIDCRDKIGKSDLDFPDLQPMADVFDKSEFIDANCWLFTSQGILVVYYGSEIGFRAGADQHVGNRDYIGQESVGIVKSKPIHAALSRIAAIRPALVVPQRDLQLKLEITYDTAASFLVYSYEGQNQTTLVLPTIGASAPWVFE